MKQEKYYFKDTSSTTCYTLKDHLDDFDFVGINEITLIEAIPDNNNPDYIFCGYAGEVGERSECKKALCPHYSSKSGRGVCKHRGKLFTHGEEITFNR